MFMTGSHKFQLMFNALLLNHATFVCVEQAAFPVKPATEHSLRILTAVIDGMRHWSQFKDKVPYLFEIFGELICYPSCALTGFIFIFLKKNTINLTGFTSPSATLDSAVTVGRYGAKNFLLRDGKEVVQCVFYENVSRGKKFKQMWLECKMSFTGTVWFTIQKRKVKPLSWSVATYCNFKI